MSGPLFPSRKCSGHFNYFGGLIKTQELNTVGP